MHPDRIQARTFGAGLQLLIEAWLCKFETIREIKREPMFLPFACSLQALTEQLKKANTDSENSDEWVTVNGQHVNVGENGQVISGNPKVMGEKAGFSNEGKGEKKKQNKNSEKQK